MAAVRGAPKCLTFSNIKWSDRRDDEKTPIHDHMLRAVGSDRIGEGYLHRPKRGRSGVWRRLRGCAGLERVWKLLKLGSGEHFAYLRNL